MSELAVDYLLDGKYRIVRLVGQGAWATVYEAVNVRIQRRVAIKILNFELSTHPELSARFNREAEAATQIDSPYVVTVYDAGTLPDDGRPYIVMEFLQGEDLGHRLKRMGTIGEEEAARYAIHLLSGLADAHATGILHRDIKPDNLVIVKAKNGEDILKLVDFGISKPSHARPEMLQMTKTDTVLGSPVYMSPEQARGTRHMDHRSDLYSVGVVLFETLTGHLPHEADNFNELMFKVALEDAPDPRTRKPDIDPAMCAMVKKALSREPDKRFQTALEFREALVEWANARGSAEPASPFVTSKTRLRAAEKAMDGGDGDKLDDAAKGRATGDPRPNPGSDPDAKLAPEPAGPSEESLSATAKRTRGETPPPRRMLPLLIGGAVLVVVAVGATLVLSQGPAPKPAPVASAAPTVPSTPSVPPAGPSAVPSVATLASAVASAPAETANAPTVNSGGPSTTSAAGRPGVRQPAAAASSAIKTTPAAASASGAVVEGRTVRTTF